MLHDDPQFSLFVVGDRLALEFAGIVPALELTAAAVRPTEGVVRHAVVAAAGRSEQFVTFHSHRVFQGNIKVILCGAVHPNDVLIGVIDDYHVIYFVQYQVENALRRNVIDDHGKMISQYLINNLMPEYVPVA